MEYVVTVALTLDQPEETHLLREVARKAGVAEEDIISLRIQNKSIDARRGRILLQYRVMMDVGRLIPKGKVEVYRPLEAPMVCFGEKALSAPIIVVGAGPCGLLAALTLMEHGYPVTVLERGQPIARRDQAVKEFFCTRAVDADSNVLFGEGGAGTYSDGKLTARTKDGFALMMLEQLIVHGAEESIRYLTKPHIGTDRLKRIIGHITQTIREKGGEVIFSARLQRLLTKDSVVVGVEYQKDGVLYQRDTRVVLLAIGHSARDTYQMLHQTGIPMEAKAFSVGLRVEHPQQMINRAQYGKNAGHPALGAAEYALSHRGKDGRGIYTFCMCPGGFVVPSVSEAGHLAVNGMSYHERAGENANSALVVQVSPADFPSKGPLSGICYQRMLESRACQWKENYAAPIQRVEDFLARRVSKTIGDVVPTYPLGTVLADFHTLMPSYLAGGIREAIPAFAKRLHGFDLPDAILTGVESRTSAPLRILRNTEGESDTLSGLYPAGEGSGYAGGIVSAGADGIRVAFRIMKKYAPKW